MTARMTPKPFLVRPGEPCAIFCNECSPCILRLKNPNALSVYLVLASYSNPVEMYSSLAGRKRIAKEIGKPNANIRPAIRILEKLGVIECLVDTVDERAKQAVEWGTFLQLFEEVA
jgi:hypothetical protein